MRSGAVRNMCAAALLIAIGIIIPMVSPLKFVLEPVSFTLASHVAIFIAMFLSPQIAISVAIGTTIGFFLGGFPLVIVLRAASHLVFAALGAFYLKKHANIMSSQLHLRGFSLAIGLIHGACEALVVTAFYLAGNAAPGFYQASYAYTVLVLVGGGSVVHSMVDFEIALATVKVLQKQRMFASLMSVKARR